MVRPNTRIGARVLWAWVETLTRWMMALAVASAISAPVGASTIDSYGTYHGPIGSVASNFFSGVGVGLTGGVTCNGQSVVILPYSLSNYKDILATLLTAQASGQDMSLYRMMDVITSFYGGTYAYCTISAASVGIFPLW